MRVLVTNDDGIDSPGLHALAVALIEDGHDVLVAAPHEDVSGTSAAIGRLRPDQSVEVVEMRLSGVPGPAFAVEGSPSLAVFAASLGAFGPRPDLVVSGINAGLNTGYSVLHSGTVGAALTAQNLGLSALAVSLGPAEPWRWETACSFLGHALTRLERSPRGSVLNLNVPGVAPEQARGLRHARLDRFGTVRTAVGPVSEGNLQFELRPTDAAAEPGTDTALVAEGFATYTAIVGIAEASPAVSPPDEPAGRRPSSPTSRSSPRRPLRIPRKRR